MSQDADAHLNVMGVCCPLPLIELAKSVNNLKPGQTLEIIGNDPIFESSVRDFCQVNGCSVLDVSIDDKHNVSMLVRVGG